VIKFFAIYGTVICLLFAYASYSGWLFTDALHSGKWGPRGHSAYHK
jgi:hypothetical protein